MRPRAGLGLRLRLRPGLRLRCGLCGDLGAPDEGAQQGRRRQVPGAQVLGGDELHDLLGPRHDTQGVLVRCDVLNTVQHRAFGPEQRLLLAFR
ncbi:hypothetical protein OG949_41670 (plasmid) [Streptomyces scopuliridis]|uniref:hypothetical protein n=1 Tax=Streptomyces scopuliridis TaxID=452529 RepID=UPI002DD8B8C8|nr:hypothetical protein [Streptomyces scopuliridis]WSB39258.1 hypothetical protein OG949_41670 [Streptomyces scopuliridis]